MKALYFKISLPNVTSLPFFSDIYYTNDANYTGNPVTLRENAGVGVTLTTPFVRNGFQVLSLSLNMGINSYEPGNAIIEFDNTVGDWQTVVMGANLKNCEVQVYYLESDGEIYTDNRIGTYRIDNWSFPTPLKFQLELTDDSPDRHGNELPVITKDGEYQLSTVDDTAVGKNIAMGFGNFSTLSLPTTAGGMLTGFKAPATIDGAACHYFCTLTPADSNITISRVWVGGVEETTPGVWHVHQMQAYYPSGQEARMAYVQWQTTVPDDLEITFEANFYNYTSAKMLQYFLGIAGGFADMDYGSVMNDRFADEMYRRGFDSSSSSYLKVAYQEKKTPTQLIQEFCDSVGGAKWRLNNRRQPELIALGPGNIDDVDYTLGQADILDLNFKSNYNEIENIFNFEYGYIPQSSSWMYKNSYESYNRKMSRTLYGRFESTESKKLRWIYSDLYARTAAIFTEIDKCLPRIEVNVVLNDDTCPQGIKPGDIIKFKSTQAIDKGADYRYYQIERVSRNFVDGGIDTEMIDITHIADMDYARKFTLQPQWSGTNFYNQSIAYYQQSQSVSNAGSDKMTISADATALSEFSWRTNDPASSDAYLYYSTNANDFINILNNTDCCISFRCKLTDTSTAQMFCCGSRLSVQNDYWRINYNKDYKRIGFVLYINDIATVSCVTANNSITDTNWHHIVFQKRGTAFELYIDGVIAGTTTSSATNAITGNLFVGVQSTVSGGLAQYFTGYMEEFHIWHEANPWNCNGSTCTAQTAPVTWFGVNNAWPFYGTPAV